MKITYSMTLSSVRQAMLFSASPRAGDNLENLIVEHLDTVRELRAIDGKMASLIVLVAQGYNLKECGEILGLSNRTMTRRMIDLRESFFTDVVIPKMSMEVANA